MNNLTLGSLFDGSGGFPLAGIMCGINPIWASEIEPFPIRVTTKRIPQMKHYGDIAKMNGSEVEPVDIITFGSPCQDLSLAGKRDGLDGSKSSLFFEAIRIIKEMRSATNGKYPRWIVWENVPGALSSSKGQDFRTVLDEICKIKDETVHIPMPEKKWTTAGEIVGDDFSLAYRILNAQFFGVPQRRRRIFLVADFGGQSAGKILFESEGLFRDFTQKRGSRQRTASNAETGVNKAVSFEPGITARMGGHCAENQTNTLRAHMGDNQMCVAIENHPNDSRVKIDESGTIQTLTGRAGTGGGNVPMVMNKREHIGSQDGIAVVCVDQGGGKSSCGISVDKSPTLACTHGGEPVVCIPASNIECCENNTSNNDGVSENISFEFNTKKHYAVYALDRASYNQGKNAKFNFSITDDGTSQTVIAKGPGAVATTYSTSKNSRHTKAKTEIADTLVASDYKDPPCINNKDYIVRRITPLECCRLQGFPDYWCDNLGTENPTAADIKEWSDIFETHRKALGKSSKPKSEKQIIKWLKNPYSDSAMYSMWGNGVCLNVVIMLMLGIQMAADRNLY